MNDATRADGDEVEVTRAPERARWEARIAGALAGWLVYRLDADGRTVLEHTEVAPAFEGRGVGSRLAETALGAIRAAGGRARIECPFLSVWTRRHREFDDIIDRT